MHVSIMERATERVVARVPVELGALNYAPTEIEHFDEAWQCAVDDGLVEANKRDEYRFTLAP